MNKIRMNTPLVEMDGDEMTRVMWADIKRLLIEPYIELITEYYDLSVLNRDLTDDAVTIASAEATRRLGVAVKCATITANRQRVEEFDLKAMLPSPNITIRALLDGTVFRAPIVVRGISPGVRAWKKPITIARHAYGDIYKNVEAVVPAGCNAELVITGPHSERMAVHAFDGAGIVMAMHNTDASITSFARSCMAYAVQTGQDLWFSTKDTISKTYDGHFRTLFEEIYDNEYAAAFKERGITYFYTLIDDAVARVMRSEGGFIWACKNYDGDVMSDMLATAFGSLSMMTSVLVAPGGQYEYEAAHGTVTAHYRRYLKGEETSTNPVATIFAWTGALRKRGELDALDALAAFADRLERATLDTIEAGYMTGDLAPLFEGDARRLNTVAFLDKVAERL